MQDEVNLYVVCAVDSIGRGEAKAFSLSRVTESRDARPFSIFILRTEKDQYFGYVNACPHQGAWLNIGDGKFFSDDGKNLRCARHKAEFEMETGLCVKGPCKEKSIEPIALVVAGGEVCVCGVELEEEAPFAIDELDETMEIMIHPG